MISWASVTSTLGHALSLSFINHPHSALVTMAARMWIQTMPPRVEASDKRREMTLFVSGWDEVWVAFCLHAFFSCSHTNGDHTCYQPNTQMTYSIYTKVVLRIYVLSEPGNALWICFVNAHKTTSLDQRAKKQAVSVFYVAVCPLRQMLPSKLPSFIVLCASFVLCHKTRAMKY